MTASSRNWTMHQAECANVGLSGPDVNVTRSAVLAIPNMEISAKALMSCCKGNTGEYSPPNANASCMIYCELKKLEDAEEKDLLKCMNDTAKGEKDDPAGGFGWTTIPARNENGSVVQSNGAAGMIDATRGGLAGYLVLGLAVSGAVFGLL